MYPFRAIRREEIKDYITGDASLKITELLLDSLADERFEHCIGRTSNCKGWNKEYGDYVIDTYTYLKPKYNKKQEDGFYEEIYYFHSKKESDEFYTALNKIMNNEAPF